MKVALFHNFTDKLFTGYWNGKAKTFKPGSQRYLPDYLARHYAKHLTNQVLLEEGKETMTSPKFPDQVPDFMAIFNKIYIPQEGDDEDSDEENLDEAEMDSELAERRHKEEVPKWLKDKPAQVIGSSDGGDEDYVPSDADTTKESGT